MWIYLHSDRFPQNTNRHNRLEVVSVGPNQYRDLKTAYDKLRYLILLKPSFWN